jgi:hypothetical protein
LAALDGSDPTLRARLYQELGIEGTYDPHGRNCRRSGDRRRAERQQRGERRQADRTSRTDRPHQRHRPQGRGMVANAR